MNLTYGQLQERSWLRDALTRTAPNDGPMFTQIIREFMRITDTDLTEMSMTLDVSVPTVRGWMNSKRLPAEQLRPGIFQHLLERMQS